MMHRTNWLRRIGIAVTCLTLLAFGLARADDAASSAEPFQLGTTKPFIHAQLGVMQYGIVLELPVKRGQAVKVGDVLLRQDDRQERAELERLQLEADSNVRVDTAVARSEERRVGKECRSRWVA